MNYKQASLWSAVLAMLAATGPLPHAPEPDVDKLPDATDAGRNARERDEANRARFPSRKKRLRAKYGRKGKKRHGSQSSQEEKNMDKDKVTMSQEAWEGVNAERIDNLFEIIRTALRERRLIGISQKMASSVVERKETPEGIQATIHPRQEITFSVRTGPVVLKAKDATELLRRLEEEKL